MAINTRRTRLYLGEQPQVFHPACQVAQAAKLEITRADPTYGTALLLGDVRLQPAPPAWFPDPTPRHQLRWWDGSIWSPNVSDGGQQGHDPIG